MVLCCHHVPYNATLPWPAGKYSCGLGSSASLCASQLWRGGCSQGLIQLSVHLGFVESPMLGDGEEDDSTCCQGADLCLVVFNPPYLHLATPKQLPVVVEPAKGWMCGGCCRLHVRWAALGSSQPHIKLISFRWPQLTLMGTSHANPGHLLSTQSNVGG